MKLLKLVPTINVLNLPFLFTSDTMTSCIEDLLTSVLLQISSLKKQVAQKEQALIQKDKVVY